jgi:lysophospholipase L1-like esterase
MPAWDFANFTPSLIILAMGVNDYSTGALEDLPTWKEAYLKIARAICDKHGANIPVLFTVAAIETNADGAYPCVQQVADQLRADGLRTEVCRFSFRVSGHPNRAEHQAMAEELYQFIVERGMLR